jgi:hypothetical protein
MVEELPDEELDPNSDESSSEERSQSDEQPGDQNRRLTEPDSPEEVPPFIEAEETSAHSADDHAEERQPSEPLPHRHPTGTPGLTGGWMAEADAEHTIDAEPKTDPLMTEPSSEGTTPEHLAPPPSSEVIPERVPERDPSATQVGPAAYLHVWDSNSGESSRSGGWGGCLLRMAILSVFAIAAIGIGLGSFALYQYYALASTLPSVEDLQQHAAQFETTRILDRNGNQLYEILDPQAGRRTYVPMEKRSFPGHPPLLSRSRAISCFLQKSNPNVLPCAKSERLCWPPK